MHGRRGSVEAPQDQLLVRVVPCVPYRYVLEQTTICAQGLVGLGAHLLAALAHGPYAAILQPRLVPLEKVVSHVLQALLRQCHCNPLVPLLALWCGQVGDEIAKHQKCVPLGPLANGRNDFLYGLGVVWGQVAPHDIPHSVARYQLEADNVRPLVLERFYIEVLRYPVEDSNTTAVRAWRLRSHHLVATILTHINTLCELSLLEYFQVHIGLENYVQGGFQAPVTTVPYVVHSKTNQAGRTYHPLSFAPTSPRRNTCTTPHTQLT